MHAAAHRTDQAQHDDRRRHGRVRCSGVSCRFAGQVEDLSASGLRLRLDRPSPVGLDSSLTLVVGSAAATIEVKARVIWSRSRPSGHELGLEFVGASEPIRTALFNMAWNGPDAAGPLTSLGLSVGGA
jgi:hypothetical protein